MQPLPRIKDRKLIEIDRDNFDQVLAAQAPRLALRVDNKLSDDGSKMNVEMKFNNLADFEPDQVVQQVEPLRKLLETRDKLRDLLTKIDRSQDLENVLEQVLENTDKLKELSADLGVTMTADVNDKTIIWAIELAWIGTAKIVLSSPGLRPISVSRL